MWWSDFAEVALGKIPGIAGDRIKSPELAALLCCFSFLLSISAAFPACVGRLLHRIGFYSVIYWEKGFCLLCAYDAPHMHCYRNNLIWSAWDFKYRAVRSQKKHLAKKRAFLCSLCWNWKSRKNPQMPVPLRSSTIRTRQLPAPAPVGICGRAWCFPVSAGAAASRAMDREGEGWRLCGSELCCGEAMVPHLERGADARREVFPVVSSSPLIHSHFWM